MHGPPRSRLAAVVGRTHAGKRHRHLPVRATHPQTRGSPPTNVQDRMGPHIATAGRPSTRRPARRFAYLLELAAKPAGARMHRRGAFERVGPASESPIMPGLLRCTCGFVPDVGVPRGCPLDLALSRGGACPWRRSQQAVPTRPRAAPHVVAPRMKAASRHRHTRAHRNPGSHTDAHAHASSMLRDPRRWVGRGNRRPHP
jgi:hypothetical protein